MATVALFVTVQGAVGSGGDADEREPSDASADEAFDGETDPCANASDLTVGSLGDGDIEDASGTTTSDDADPGGAGLTLGEVDGTLEFPGGVGSERATDGDAIGFRDAVTGMGKSDGEQAIVGDDDEALGVPVESASAEEAGADAREDVDDGALSGLRDVGADEAARLIKEEGSWGLGREGATVDGDGRGGQVDARAECCDGMAVDADAARRDEFLGGSTTCHPAGGEHFLQTLFDDISPQVYFSLSTS